MQKWILLLWTCMLAIIATAQNQGDTIKVKAFHYASSARDTTVNFPDQSKLTFEKILMKYSMRCKGARISTSTDRNLGCGEWDYSCNTFVVDSSKVEEVAATTPEYSISNFKGNSFKYSTKPIYDYFDFGLKNVTVKNVLNENQYRLENGAQAIPMLLQTSLKSGKTLLLYKASALSSAGLTAGNLNGIVLTVANQGGTARFMKVKLKPVASSVLKPENLDFGGFTEVFNDHYTYKKGANRIQFYTPFVWDGTSNILVEVSYTNSSPNTNIELEGSLENTTASLYSNNNYAVDLSSSGHLNISGSNMNGLSNEISVGFWAYGDTAALPANTCVLYGHGANKYERQLNIHFPWSDSKIYFDCGYSAGGFDRIEKQATTSEIEGQWNYWFFTKNAVTGQMKIYLNGSLWYAVESKTKPITIQSLILGKNPDLNENYKGKIRELSIWGKALGLDTIKSWQNKPIDTNHPNYADLLAYYKLDEGAGQSAGDAKFKLIAAGTNLQWSYDRGDKLAQTFTATNYQPNITFLRGDYELTTTVVSSRDSLERTPNTVNRFAIKSNKGVTPLRHDDINTIETRYLWEALPSKIYDGDNGKLKGTANIAVNGEILVSNLSYTLRFPFYNELSSFVTPYGIGLDLGPAGKSWYFNVSDYAPVLSGNKRVMMSLGGQNQEENEVEFWFIVGTPARTVLEFNQLWQGAARIGGPSIGSIRNNSAFPELKVPILSTAKEVKLKSTVTGHGSDGEFQQNGGIINHSINIDGGAEEFVWNINKECSLNPVFPQGGTWLYDRQGWCPGEPSLVQENDLTFYVTPGKTTTIDYNCSTPDKPSGDYRFIAAHQLITYGDPNLKLDANITGIFRPTDHAVFSRFNPMCAKPFIEIQNTGADEINKMVIEYWVNNSTAVQSYSWTGNLNFLEITTIELPIGNLWSGVLPSGNQFHVRIKSVNGGVDQNSSNNRMTSNFQIPIVVPSNFTVEFKSNSRPLENSYRIFNENGGTVATKTFSVVNNVYKDNFSLNGCYRLVITDKEQDGLQWWANQAQGTGYLSIKNSAGDIIYTIQPDFGDYFEFSFTTDQALQLEENDWGQSIQLYPNPTEGQFTLEGFGLESATVEITNLVGAKLSLPMQKGYYKMNYDVSHLQAGIYFAVIRKAGKTTVRKFIVQ